MTGEFENLFGGIMIGVMITIALAVGLIQNTKTNSNDIVLSPKQKCPNWTMSDGKGNAFCVDLKF